MELKSVLFVGERNAARSIMAETCFNAASLIEWRAFSAGWQTQRRIDPMTIRVLAEEGFPTDTLYSKPVDIFRQPGAPDIDLCVFLDETLPPDTDAYPGIKEYWRIANPHGSQDGRAAYQAALGAVTARISDMILSGRLAQLPDRYREAG